MEVFESFFGKWKNKKRSDSFSEIECDEVSEYFKDYPCNINKQKHDLIGNSVTSITLSKYYPYINIVFPQSKEAYSESTFTAFFQVSKKNSIIKIKQGFPDIGNPRIDVIGEEGFRRFTTSSIDELCKVVDLNSKNVQLASLLNISIDELDNQNNIYSFLRGDTINSYRFKDFMECELNNTIRGYIYTSIDIDSNNDLFERLSKMRFKRI